jgi:uncharacterized protein YqgV (UPF0045/DUF77 family)
MDSELIDYLKAMESRFDEKLEKMESRFEGKLDAVEQRIHDHVAEVVHDSESRIVGTFMKIVHTHETRMSLHESTNNSLLARVALLEARMLDIERQRPPQ